MRKVLYAVGLAAAAGCVSLLLRCTDQQNPFADTANARAVFLAQESDVADGDSVCMFTTRQVSVAVLVSELVDSFALHADSSYRCADTVVRAPGSESYAFAVAFADTGRKSLCLTTYRAGGDRSVEQLTARVYSPLHQTDLTAGVGDDLPLSTPRVGDSVRYHWCIGDDSVYARDTASADVWQMTKRILTVGTLPGELWVSVTGQGRDYVSPVSRFRVVLDDNAGPQIVCLNDSRNDTLTAGAVSFVFRVNVYDGGGVEQVTIDGIPPYEYYPGLYRKELTGLDTAALTPRPIAVAARDRSGNQSTRTFFIVYDPLALQRTQIYVTSVPRVPTSREDFPLDGGVREYLRSTVYVTTQVNGIGSADTLPVAVPAGTQEAGFRISVRLTEETNNVVLRALDSTGVALAETTVTIVYRADYVDTMPPKVMGVTVAGKLAEAGNRVLVPDTLPAVVVQAYDESGIASVRVNSQEYAQALPFEWRGTVGPVAYGSALAVAVVLRDSAGQELSHQFLVQKNLPPAMPSGWTWPWRLFAGDPLALTFSVQDEEERVSVRLESAPASMTVARGTGRNEWTIHWTPSEADTGQYLTRVVLDDSLESVTLPWQYRVLRDSTMLVRFLTAPSAFPRYLEAGRDTLAVTLAVAPGKGTAPYRFDVELEDQGRLLLSVTDTAGTAVLAWAPLEADTGVHHVVVTVTDGVGDGDRLDRDIEVVPGNRDSCRLAWTRPAGVDTTAYGELDMRSAAGPLALTFAILDSDHPYTERYMRTVTQRGSRMVDTLDSALAFTVTLDTSYAVPHDTVVVTVADRTGGRDTVRIPVLYPYAPPRFPDTWEWPVRFVGGTRYALGVGIVSPFHQAQLALSGAPAGMAFAPLAPVNTWTLAYEAMPSDSGVYHATVTLSDPYVDTAIAWSFVVLADSSRLTRFSANSAQLLPYATAGRMVAWLLATEPGSGTLPLHYTVRCPSTGAVLCDTSTSAPSGVTVLWVPQASDVGRRLLVMTVCDSLGDCDTLVRDVEVLPVNRYPCHLTMTRSSGSDTTLDGAVNMATAVAPCTLRFAIEDQDHPLTEQYTAFITRAGITSAEPLDTSRAFEMVIDVSPGRWGSDTVTVVVLDATGTSSMVVVRVWYGVPLPVVSGGARAEVHMVAGTAQTALVNQNDTLFVNEWTGSPGLLAFAANTFGGAPPVLDTVQSPPSVRFYRTDGSNLIAEMSRNVWRWADSAFTVFVVARPDQVLATGNHCLLATSDSDAGYMALGITDGYAGAFSTAGGSRSTATVAAGQWHVFCYSSTAGRQGTALAVSAWVDGAAGGVCMVSESFIGYHTMLGAAVRSGAVHGWQGRVAEVLMYRGSLADLDRRQVEAYLAARYGVALP